MGKLIVENVHIGYQNTVILKDVQASVEPGKLIVLIGENGTGKTTLMRTLLKLHPIMQGNISYEGKNINLFSHKAWARVFAAVFSRVASIPHIKVEELIQIGASNIGGIQKDNIIGLLEIKDLLHRFATTLSDGQLQKVMIARAILQDTPFVIFDEPTAHLDYKNKRQVFELLKKTIAHTGKTFIVITHEILHALAICDECWLIQNEHLYIGSAQAIDSKFNLTQEVLQNTNYGS